MAFMPILATVIDLYSRKVVGWSMSKANDTALVREALQMAINNKPKQQVILLHSDQGSTYRAYDYLELFKVNNITQSMSKNKIILSFCLLLGLCGVVF
jgi:putative transposase